MLEFPDQAPRGEQGPPGTQHQQHRAEKPNNHTPARSHLARITADTFAKISNAAPSSG
jgi:hypothetical protein